MQCDTLKTLMRNPSPLTIWEEFAHRGNDACKISHVKDVMEAKEHLMDHQVDPGTTYVGATYRKDKKELWIHRELEESKFQYAGKTRQTKNSIFPKCVFLFRKI